MSIRFPLPLDSHLGGDFARVLADIETTKRSLSDKLHAIAQPAKAGIESATGVVNGVRSTISLPVTAINAVDESVREHPWASVSAAFATGAVGGYIDGGATFTRLITLPWHLAIHSLGTIPQLLIASFGNLDELILSTVIRATQSAEELPCRNESAVHANESVDGISSS